MKKLVLLFTPLILLFPAKHLKAQKTDKKLQARLTALVQGFNGDIGFSITSLKSGRVAAYHADSLFPTASIVKIPILAGIMDKLENGQLSYHQKLVYKDSLLYAGEDILGAFKNNEPVELSKVMMLMLTTSDNTASLWLQSLAGGGERINEILDSAGFAQSRVNSRTPGRETNRNLYGWGQTTPAEMARLMEKIARQQWGNPQASSKMLRLLGRNAWDEQALASIPAGVFVASKNGAVNASRSEILFVNGKKRPYIFSVFTKNNGDQSWNQNNEAWAK